jgi:hypothetical protein
MNFFIECESERPTKLNGVPGSEIHRNKEDFPHFIKIQNFLIINQGLGITQFLQKY